MAGIWVRNYFNFLTAAFLGNTSTTSSTAPTDYTAPLRIRNWQGGYSSLLVERTFSSGNTDVTNIANFLAIGKLPVAMPDQYGFLHDAYHFGLAVGSGSTPANFDDYILTSPIYSGVTISNPAGTLTQPSLNYDTNKYKSEKQYIITASSPRTIQEIGLLYAYTGQVGALLYHEVFDQPINLDTGESLIVTIKRDGEIFGYQPY